MGKKRKAWKPREAAPRSWWRPITLGTLAAVLLAAGAVWLWPAASAIGGTPRLAVDRTTIDFGDVPFERWVRATFTLTNVGTGTLRIGEAPRIRVAAGC